MSVMKFELKLLALALLATTTATTTASSLNQRGNAAAAADDEPSQITVSSLGGGPVRRVDFNGSDTLRHLWEKLAKLDPSATPENLRLVYGGKQLDDESRRLSDYGIQRDSNLISLQRAASSEPSDVIPTAAAAAADVAVVEDTSPISKLFIQTISGEKIEVPANQDLTIAELKNVIEIYKSEISVEKQRLIYNGLVLDDKKTLAAYGLRDGATITLSINMNAGKPGTMPRTELKMSDPEAKKHIKEFVAAINKEPKRRFSIVFEHDPSFANLTTVQQIIWNFATKEIERSRRELWPFIREVFKSDDFHAEFTYKYRGKEEVVVTNLSNGADWITNQVRATIESEKFERDLERARKKQQSL